MNKHFLRHASIKKRETSCFSLFLLLLGWGVASATPTQGGPGGHPPIPLVNPLSPRQAHAFFSEKSYPAIQRARIYEKIDFLFCENIPRRRPREPL